MSYPSPQEQPSQHPEIVEQRTITDVRRAEDGWSVEFEDLRGIRLTYWIADSGCTPRVGDSARFYGGASGQPLHGLEINGYLVFLDASS